MIKIGHHGSKTSTSLDLLHQSEVSYALLSVGNNSYGHPSPLVLEHLNQYGVKIFNTKTDADHVLVFFHQVLWVKNVNANYILVLSQ